MKSLELVDDLLTPSKVIKVEGHMKGPVDLVDSTIDILKAVLQVSSAKAYLKKLAWGSTDGSFKGVVEGNKGFDMWTSLKVIIEVVGSQDLETKEGSAVIAIYPTIKTKYEYSNALQVMLWNIYAKKFYVNRRMQYMKQSKHLVDKIKSEYISQLGIAAKN